MSPTWIRQRIRRYAVMVGLGYVPRVIFSKKDWNAAMPKSQRVEASDGNTAGMAHAGCVYVNQESVCCRRAADDLAAHEVIHLLYPDMNHTKKFREYVSELRLGRVPE